jgi:PAH dioxygenase large subunit
LCGGQDLNFEMGLGVIGEQPNWPGPGRALASGYAEQNQRAFWGRWLELLSEDSSTDTVDTDEELA